MGIINTRGPRGKEAHTAEVEYPSFIRTCSLALCIISAAMDNAISCQVVGGSSGAGSPADVETLGSPGLSVTSFFGLTGITLVLAFQTVAVDGGGKGVSVPLEGIWAR